MPALPRTTPAAKVPASKPARPLSDAAHPPPLSHKGTAPLPPVEYESTHVPIVEYGVHFLSERRTQSSYDASTSARNLQHLLAVPMMDV